MTKLKAAIAAKLAQSNYTALCAWIKGQHVPSCGPEEDAINTAITAVCHSVHEKPDPDLGRVIETLAELRDIQPRTQKTNLRNATEAFHEAWSAYNELTDTLLERLPLQCANILEPKLRRRRFALLVPEQDHIQGHFARVFDTDPFITVRPVIERTARKDQWVLRLVISGVKTEDENTDTKVLTHPYFVKTGHLSINALSIRASVHQVPDIGDAMPTTKQFVCSVGISGAESYRHYRVDTDTPLPVATECVFGLIQAGDDWQFLSGRFSPWREQICGDPELPFLPTSGSRVRLGDLILEVPGWKVLNGQYKRIDDPWSFNSFTLPDVATETKGAFFTVPDNTDSVFWIPDDEGSPVDVVFTHRDHYRVRVFETERVPPNRRAILITQIAGHTQYQPPEHQAD